MTKKHHIVFYLIPITLIVALALIKWMFLQQPVSNQGSRRESPSGPMQVSTQALHPEPISDRITTNGMVLANESIEIRSEVTGNVMAIYFEEGTLVEKDAILVKIDDRELKARELISRHRVSLAQTSAKRQQQLLERKMTSQEEYDTVISELNIANAELQLVETQIAKTEIRAPFSGHIGLRQISPGSYITPSMIITTLVDRRIVRIGFSIPEKYSGQIPVGSPISFQIQATTQRFDAAIVMLDSAIDSATHSLRMQARLANENDIFIPGSSVHVEVPIAARPAFMVPNSALIPELKGHRIFLLQDGKAVSRQVSIGTRTTDRIEIISGVMEGDLLITSAILQLRDGMAVQSGSGRPENNTPEIR